MIFARPLAVLLLITCPLFAERPRLGAPPLKKAPELRARAPRALSPVGGFTVDTANREQVRRFYNAVFSATDGKFIAWTGNVTTGTPGAVSADFREASLVRVNFFRAMAGIPAAVSFSPAFDAKCQQAALMFSVNGDISHTPPNTWTFYTAEAAEAAGNSNISIGVYGPESIAGYMEDPAAGNEPVGHRRWLLYPQTQTMGIGDVPPVAVTDGVLFGSNANWVIDSHFADARPTVRDGFIAWPPPGFVPYQLVYPRWSFSHTDADFSSTTVTLTRNGANVPVALQPVADGYGENTLVWVPQGANPDDFRPAAPADDVVWSVTVNGVKFGAQTQNFSYTVRAFDPANAGAGSEIVTIAGPANLVLPTAGNYSAAGLAGVAEYDWRAGALAARSAIEGAEAGLAGVVAFPPGSSPLANTGASGARSFHLTNPLFESTWFDLAATLLPRTGAVLSFKTRLGFAGPGQTARVQVSADDGLTWKDVFSRRGTDSAGQTAFAAQQVSLGAWVGRAIRIRFRLDVRPGEALYPDTDTATGWLVDDIAFTATDELATAATARQATPFSYTPATPVEHAVLARPVLFGGYPGEWTLRRIAATAPVAALTVNIAGPGNVSAGFAGTTDRQQGDKLTIRATPTTGNVFTGWTGDIASETATLTFTMPATLTLTANFGPNRFPLAAGRYTGLIAAQPGSHATAGIISVKVAASGAFTGKFMLGGKTTTFTGALTGSGRAYFGKAETFAGIAFTAMLAANPPAEITGTLHGAPFVLSRYLHAAKPAGPQLAVPAHWPGSYTARITAAPPAAIAEWPEGHGWMRMSVNSAGRAGLSGKLADGTKFTATALPSVNGKFPLLAVLHGGKGSISGELTLALDAAVSAPLRWFRPVSPPSVVRFGNGWPAGLDATLAGGKYNRPVFPNLAIPALTAGAQFRVEKGDVPVAQTWPIAVSDRHRVSLDASATDRTLRCSIDAAAGTFSATWRDQTTGRAYVTRGVILQGENRLVGYTLGPLGSAEVVLE